MVLAGELVLAAALLHGVVNANFLPHAQPVVDWSDVPTHERFGSMCIPVTTAVKVTAYCLCVECTGKVEPIDEIVTSLGDPGIILDGVAADYGLFPRRSIVSIPGIGIREVDDTGIAMRDSEDAGIPHIDVRMASHEEARAFGVQWLPVTAYCIG